MHLIRSAVAGCLATLAVAQDQTIAASSFVRAGLRDPAQEEQVRRSGSLRGGETGEAALGWFEYEVQVPADGWYAVTVPGGNAQLDVRIGEAVAHGTDAQGQAGSFWLGQGVANRLRLELARHPGFPGIRSLRLAAATEAAGKVRVAVADGLSVLRRGETVSLSVQSGDLAVPATLGVRLMLGDATVSSQDLRLVDGAGERTVPLAVACPVAGACRLEFMVDGKAPGTRNLRPIPLQVVDTALQPATGGEISTRPVAAIDCAATAPPYGIGGTRVVSTGAGTYRESGTVSYLAHQNATEPTWFAYGVSVPEAQRLYRIEVDYPDDGLRTFIIAIREAMRSTPDLLAMYPTAAGVDSGGQYSLTGRMQTHTILHWARTRDLRVVLVPGRDGHRAAAARIRVEQVQGELPLPRLPAAGGRSFANWYEEGSNYARVFGAPDASLPGMALAADRWARGIRHMGGDTLWMTMAVYQFGLYPSRYNVQFTSSSSPDVVRAVLLNCERYGMRFIGEFHPEARELNWPANRDPEGRHLAVNRQGRTMTKPTEPIYNLMWPANRAWYLGMIGEFAERYQDSPSLRGVCLRLMDWVDPGLNSFHDLDWGYDDYTTGLFERETGIRIPVEGPARRSAWLLAEQKPAWVAWRCAKVEELYRQVAERVRRVRPDLMVYSNWHMAVADPREAGIDPQRLQAIPGVAIVDGARCSTRENNELVVQEHRDLLLEPVRRFATIEGRSSLISGSDYFEGLRDVIIPEDLGFPADTRRTWICAMVTPAGRHNNERWTIPLAGSDTGFLADGGNAYTVGQPILREFLADYRWIPDLPFQRRADASDPVAVWSREVGAGDLAGLGVKGGDGILPGFHVYAVNRERFPVRVAIALERAGTSVVRPSTGAAIDLQDGRLVCTLAPYEVRSFRAVAGAAISAVEVTPPAEAVRHAEGLAGFLGTLAAEAAAGTVEVAMRPRQVELLTARAAEARRELAHGHLWRTRTLAEHHALRKIYDRVQRQPPGLRDLGDPASPVGAWQPRDLQRLMRGGDATVVPSASISTAWPEQELLTTRDASLAFELAIAVDGYAGVDLGCLVGGAHGAIEVSVDGTVVGTVGGGGGSVRSLAGSPGKPVAFRKGTSRLVLRRLDGDTMSLRFLALTPVYIDMVAECWASIGQFPVTTPSGKPPTGKELREALTIAWPKLEAGCNVDERVVIDGQELRWLPLRGESDLVDLGAAGTINYVATRIVSPCEARVRLRYDMDYWQRIWLNGVLVKDVELHTGAPSKGKFALDVTLRSGPNDLVFKLAGGSMGNSFWMEINDIKGLRIVNPAMSASPAP